MPLALKRYLSENPNIRFITLRLDNDATGGRAAKALVSMLSDRYEVSIRPPPYGKDYNDYLCIRLGLPLTPRTGKGQERWPVIIGQSHRSTQRASEPAIYQQASCL